MKKVNLKILSIRFIFIILGVAIGLLIMAQFRTIPDRITNPETPKMSLRETRDLLYSEQKELNKEAEIIQKESLAMQTQISEKSESKGAAAALAKQRSIAGYTKMAGPGVTITLDDSDSGQTAEESIAHAADIRDILNLLWSSGAEAISINDQRVVFTTAVDCIVNTILINNARISAPFVLKAIGDQARVKAALESSFNLADIKRRVRDNNLQFRTSYSNNLQIPAYAGSFMLSTESK